MGQDFFDDVIPETPESVPFSTPASDKAPAAITDAARRRMTRQKEATTTQAVGTSREIDELRLQQERLERERNALENLTRKQEHYETTKRDMIETLTRAVVLVQKDQHQATRLCELLSVMSDRFRDTLEELRGINEAGWNDESFEDELDRALVLLEDARKVYSRGMAKIEAESWHKVSEGKHAPSVLSKGRTLDGMPRRFGFWLMAGTAFTIPIIVLAILSLVVTLVLRHFGWV